MKRDKKWWDKLTSVERSELVTLERENNRSYPSTYIPDDCCECGYCGTPHLGSGLCPLCSKRMIELIDKANGI